MPTVLVNPFAENLAENRTAAQRLEILSGKTIGLLDISKPGGSLFLDRLEGILKERFGVSRVVRVMKPTFTKPAPEDILQQIIDSNCQAVIEALAD